MYMCVCICVCMYVCMCVSVCVCGGGGKLDLCLRRVKRSTSISRCGSGISAVVGWSGPHECHVHIQYVYMAFISVYSGSTILR